MLDAYAAGVFRLMVPGRGTVRPARDRVCAAGARSRPMLLELIRAAPDPEWTQKSWNVSLTSISLSISSAWKRKCAKSSGACRMSSKQLTT